MGIRRRSYGAAEGPLPRTGAEELAAGSGPSAGCVGDAVIDFIGRAKAEAKSGAMVELEGEGGALALGERGERGALGQILPEQPVGVFISPAFPSVVRRGEVDRGAQAPLERFIHMELGAVVGRDGADQMRFVAQDVGGAPQGLLGPDAWDLTDAHEATFAFDDRDGGGFAAAVHGIDLPVAETGAPLDDGGAFRDHPLTREPAAAVVTSVALALDLAGAAQMAPHRATGFLVGPDPQIDRLMAHAPDALAAQTADDLFRTKVFAQHAFNGDEVRRPKAPVATGAPASTMGLLHGPARAVGAIIPRAVPLHLTPDRASVPLQLPRDLRSAAAAHPQRANRVSFLSAQLVVCHPPKMSHLLPESKLLKSILEIHRPDLNAKFPGICDKADKVRRFRNRLAHSHVKADVNDIAQSQDGKVTFCFYEDGERKEYVGSQEDFHVRIKEATELLLVLMELRDLLGTPANEKA
jgi:hypothetical protein